MLCPVCFFSSTLWRDWRSCVRTRCVPACLWKTLPRSSFWLTCTAPTSSKRRPSTSSTSKFVLRRVRVITIIRSTAPSRRSTRAHWTFCLCCWVFVSLFLHRCIITDGTCARSHPATSSLGFIIQFHMSPHGVVCVRDQDSLTPLYSLYWCSICMYFFSRFPPSTMLNLSFIHRQIICLNKWVVGRLYLIKRFHLILSVLYFVCYY